MAAQGKERFTVTANPNDATIKVMAARSKLWINITLTSPAMREHGENGGGITHFEWIAFNNGVSTPCFKIRHFDCAANCHVCLVDFKKQLILLFIILQPEHIGFNHVGSTF